MKKLVRGLFGVIAAVVSYIPFLLLARWVATGEGMVGYIAAGLFAFFGLLFAMAIFCWLGIEGKEEHTPVVLPASGKAGDKEKLDPISAGIAVATGMEDIED